MVNYLKPLLLYSDEESRQKEDVFRKITLIGNVFEIISYSFLIKLIIIQGRLDVQSYKHAKFDRLNRFLVGFDKIEKASHNYSFCIEEIDNSYYLITAYQFISGGEK